MSTDKKSRRSLRFSLRSLLVLITISALVVYFYPRPLRPGPPNLIGQITDANGVPLSDVTVNLYSGFATRFEVGQTKTDSNGQYEFRPLPGGGMIMPSEQEFAKQFVGITVKHATHCSADGKSWWDESVPMIKDQDYRFDLKMVPGGSVSGSVTNENTGTAVGVVDLRIKNTTYLRYIQTNQKGLFSAAAIPAGTYVVDINDPKLDYPVLGTLQITPGAEKEVELTWKSADR